jgi:hypothetical protein
MRDIAIAFALSAAAALAAGSIMDAAAASTAFGVVFPTIIAVLERRERDRDRQRAEALRRQVAAQPPQPPPVDATPPDSGAQAELQALERRARLPAVDWGRVAIGTAASALLVGPLLVGLFPLTLIVVLISGLPAVLLSLPLLIAALILFAAGYWIGRTSNAGGVLGAALAGSIVGLVANLVFFLFLGGDTTAGNVAWAFVVFTGGGALSASIGGLLATRQRQRAPAGL